MDLAASLWAATEKHPVVSAEMLTEPALKGLALSFRPNTQTLIVTTSKLDDRFWEWKCFVKTAKSLQREAASVSFPQRKVLHFPGL